jgi:hypothetical protein
MDENLCSLLCRNDPYGKRVVVCQRPDSDANRLMEDQRSNLSSLHKNVFPRDMSKRKSDGLAFRAIRPLAAVIANLPVIQVSSSLVLVIVPTNHSSRLALSGITLISIDTLAELTPPNLVVDILVEET